MKMNKKKAGKVLTLSVVAATLLVALYIMLGRKGLQDSLDFGAGAYFYADIPEFEKYTSAVDLQGGLPFIVYVGLFLLWGALMYWLWKKIG